MSTFRIREAQLPRDRPALCEFIMGSQRYEHAIEPDRRLPVMMIGVLSGNTRARKIYETSGFRHYALRLRKEL